MSMTMTRTAAALRLRTLSAQGSPFTVPMAGVPGVAGIAWQGNHNSIAANVPAAVPTAVATPVRTARADYGAAKQAAPPRGEPR